MNVLEKLKEGVDVFIQSNTSNLFRAFLQTYDKEDITLAVAAAVDDESITAATGHGITTGDMLIIYTADYYQQIEVTGVVDDVISLEAPIYLPFSVEDTTIIRGKTNIGVASGITFKFGIPGENIVPIDVNKIVAVMGHSAQGDDGKFGGITALTNGVLFRKENTIKMNLGVYKTNADFRLIGAKVEYPDGAPAGSYGTVITIPLQGQENFDQVERLLFGTFLELKTRDALGGLDYFKIALIGSYTSGE